MTGIRLEMLRDNFLNKEKVERKEEDYWIPGIKYSKPFSLIKLFFYSYFFA
jgi:hypothetical protein